MMSVIFFFIFPARCLAGDPELTFAEAYRAIMDRNLRTPNQELVIERSEKGRLQALGSFLPTVTAELKDIEGSVALTNRRSAGVSASVNLFRSGGDIAGVKAANREIESQKLTLAREKQNAEDDAVLALIQYIAQKQFVEIGEKLALLRTDSLRVAKERFNRGLMPQQEVDKTAIDLELTRADLADTVVKLNEADSTLQTALGHTNVLIGWPWMSVMTRTSEVELMRFDLLKRPDYLAALANAESRKWRKRQAGASLLPSLNFNASYGNQTLGASDQPEFVGILTLSIPLFEGFKNWGAFGIERANERQAELNTEVVRRLAPAEVTSLRTSYRISRESALAREKNAKLTRRLYDDNLQRFRLGRASANDIAIDQARLLKSQQLEVQGWLNAHASLLKLCHALGGFVDPAGECQER